MLKKPVVRFCNTLSRKDVVDLCQLKEQHWPKGLKKQIFWWFFLTNKQDKLVLTITLATIFLGVFVLGFIGMIVNLSS